MDTIHNTKNKRRVRMNSVPMLTPDASQKLGKLGNEVNGSSISGISALILEAAKDCPRDRFFEMLQTLQRFRAE